MFLTWKGRLCCKTGFMAVIIYCEVTNPHNCGGAKSQVHLKNNRAEREGCTATSWKAVSPRPVA